MAEGESPMSAALGAVVRSMDEESVYRVRLDGLLVDTQGAAEILGLAQSTLRKYYERRLWWPLLEPAIEIDDGSWVRVRLFWRHRIEELARRRKEQPHQGGPRSWELVADLHERRRTAFGKTFLPPLPARRGKSNTIDDGASGEAEAETQAP